MLDDAGPDEVWCETLDDILLYRQLEASVEYVQAKTTSHPEWTLARACQRDGGKTGSSLVERSLARDRASESALFKIVTSSPVDVDLRPLKRVRAERNQVDFRAELDSLAEELSAKLGNATVSPNGHDFQYWVQNCVWDVRQGDTALLHENEKRILRAAEVAGVVLMIDQAGEIYAKLLQWVYATARADYRVAPSRKCIARANFRAWLTNALREAAGTWHARPGDGLVKKFAAARIPDTELDGAAALRTQYRLERLRPRYLDSREFGTFEAEIEAELRLLRSRVDAQIVPDEGLLVHNKSLECVHIVVSRLDLRNLPIHLGQGFVYELTDRCLHRFRRAGA